MNLILPESDLRLAPTLGPLLRAAGRFDAALKMLRRSDAACVQLDATISGLRPRELDRRARRELLATLRRTEVQAAGIDLFIPRDHFAQSEHMDRAITAVQAAMELAADLDRIPLSLALPLDRLEEQVTDALAQAADSYSVPLAIHFEDDLDKLGKWFDEADCQWFGAALDPAALLASDVSPAKAAARLGNQLRVGRLSDLDTSTGRSSAVRCAVGSGVLDLPNYRAVLDMASRRLGPVVLDLRGLENSAAAIKQAGHAWSNAAPRLG